MTFGYRKPVPQAGAMKTDIPSLIQYLDDADPKVRTRAVVKMKELGDQKAVPALLERLGIEKDDDVRKEIVSAFNSFKDKKAAFPALIGILSGDYGWDTKAAAARALEERGNTQAVPALVNILNDRPGAFMNAVYELTGSRGAMRAEAARSLGIIGDPAARPALNDALVNDKDYSVKAAAAVALGEVGDASSLQALREFRVKAVSSQEIDAAIAKIVARTTPKRASE